MVCAPVTLLMLRAVYFIDPGKPMPACDRKHDGDVVMQGETRLQCDASIGSWFKSLQPSAQSAPASTNGAPQSAQPGSETNGSMQSNPSGTPTGYSTTPQTGAPQNGQQNGQTGTEPNNGSSMQPSGTQQQPGAEPGNYTPSTQQPSTNPPGPSN